MLYLDERTDITEAGLVGQYPSSLQLVLVAVDANYGCLGKRCDVSSRSSDTASDIL